MSRKTNAVLGVFPQRATCVPKAGAVAPTPQVDENCNGKWDDNIGGTPTCTASQTCVGSYMTSDSTCKMKAGDFSPPACQDNTSIAPGSLYSCGMFFAGLYVTMEPSDNCSSGGTFN